MPRSFSRRATIAAVLVPTLSLGACVTNEEDSTPDGWEEPHTSMVPEIAAMYDDNDGVLTAGTNPPYAPFQLRIRTGRSRALNSILRTPLPASWDSISSPWNRTSP